MRTLLFLIESTPNGYLPFFTFQRPSKRWSSDLNGVYSTLICSVNLVYLFSNFPFILSSAFVFNGQIGPLEYRHNLFCLQKFKEYIFVESKEMIFLNSDTAIRTQKDKISIWQSFLQEILNKKCLLLSINLLLFLTQRRVIEKKPICFRQ